MQNIDCDHIREQLEAYALGALEPAEQASIERHLADCADCQHLAKEYADVVHDLPEALAAASSLTPPAAIKTRLLQSIETASAAPAPAPGGRPPQTEPRAAPARRPSFWRRWRTVMAVAATILLIISLIWTIRLNVALAQERALRAEFANLVSQQELVLEVVDAAEANRDVLRSPGEGSPAYGKLFTRPDMPYLVAMAARLSPPPAGQAYHLWLFRQDQPTLAGTMNVNEQGFGLLIFEANQDDPPAYDRAEVILQPEESASPSGDPVLIWPSDS